MIYEKTRKTYTLSTRVWFGCRDCGMYGDITTRSADVDAVLDIVRARHHCIEREAS